MSVESPLPFSPDLLARARFPKLDEKGFLSICKLFINEEGFQQFLEKGWRMLESRDEVLAKLILESLAELICKNKGINDPPKTEMVKRSIRLGASLVYRALLFQTEENEQRYTLPVTNIRILTPILIDLIDEGLFVEMTEEHWKKYVRPFDPILERLILFSFDREIWENEVGVPSMTASLGMMTTYFALLSSAETSALSQTINF